MRKRDLTLTTERDEDGVRHVAVTSHLGVVRLYDNGLRILMEGAHEVVMYGADPFEQFTEHRIGNATIYLLDHGDSTATWSWSGDATDIRFRPGDPIFTTRNL